VYGFFHFFVIILFPPNRSILCGGCRRIFFLPSHAHKTKATYFFSLTPMFFFNGQEHVCATWPSCSARPNIRRARRAALRKQPSTSSWWDRAAILWFVIYHFRDAVKQLLDQLFRSLFPFSFIYCGIAYSITLL